MLGVTGSAIGHIGYGILAAPFRSWGPEGYSVGVAGATVEKIYYEWGIPACGCAYCLVTCITRGWRLVWRRRKIERVTAQPYGMNTTVIYIMLYRHHFAGSGKGHDKFAPCISYGDRCTATDAEIQSAARKAAEYGLKFP